MVNYEWHNRRQQKFLRFKKCRSQLTLNIHTVLVLSVWGSLLMSQRLRRIVRRWHCSIFQQKQNKLKHNVAQRLGKSRWEEERQTTGTHVLTSCAPASGKDWDEPLTRVYLLIVLQYHQQQLCAPGKPGASLILSIREDEFSKIWFQLQGCKQLYNN